jgi:hypothetical protein
MVGGTARVAARLGILGVLLGSAVIAALHIVGPGTAISPIRRTISEYMLTSAAWAFDVGVLAVAAGSAAILMAMARFVSGASRVGLLLGALWVAGLVTLVAFPKADWALGPSVSGQVHRVASMVAFLALPFAVIALLARRTGRGPGRGMAGWGVGLAVAGLAWFTPIVVAIASAANGGRWWTAVPLGLVERGMAVTEVAAMVVLGVWAIRFGAGTTERVPAGSTELAAVADPALADAPAAAPPVLEPLLPVPVSDPAAP